MRTLTHVLLYLVPTLTAGFAAVYALRRRYLRGGHAFALLLAATWWWCACHTISILHPEFMGTYLWSLLQYVGIVLVGPCWLLLALAYSGQWWRTRRWMRLGLFGPALLMLLIVLTNPFHGLWWPTVQPDPTRDFMWMSVTRGPAFWIHSAYAYTCIGIGVILLAYAARHSTPPNQYHARIMLVAVLIPIVGNVTFLAGVETPWRDDPTPLVILASGLVALYANLRYQLVDLGPLAEREIMAGLPDGLIVLDSFGYVAEINELAPKLLEIDGERWAGRAFSEIVAASPVLGAIRSLLDEPQIVRTRQVVYEAAGVVRGLELRTRPLLAGNGKPMGALVLLRDISERVRIEQQRTRHLTELSLLNAVAGTANSATETERLIRTIAETILAAGEWDRVAVGLLDHHAGLNIVVDQSTAGERHFAGQLISGAAGAELLTLTHAGATRQIARTDQRDQLPCVQAQMEREGLEALVVVPLYHQGKSLGLLLLGNRLRRPADAAYLHLAETIGELITDAAVRTRLYEKLHAADRLKASFLASVSHELRTPLTSIIGYIEMLERGRYGPPGDAMREPFAHMRQSSRTLLRLINDIVEFSRMESGYLTIELEPVSLLRPLYNVVGQLQPQAAERGLELRVELDPDLPPVRANLARLEQVLSNLVSNAIKFTDAGTITVAARRHGDLIRLSVHDTGIGIAPEHQALIFEEFQRVAQPPGRHTNGAGLGLAICRRLVELMGGTIGVTSAVDAGATFYCDFAPAEALLQTAVGVHTQEAG
jgi:PAS domain S-box-containing protein